ncbi:DUF7716 domain-containing protein [Pluralibacter gergoviae]|uniref:DUF7716 domain-containing protein n=1 Tax=Pluralibacter gergoviae TaxID=61647 RepID=UPI0006510534|nr:hypothetical protein [Pluralibacter gergoviae]EKT9639108.1 hypothetical protein [Pluralibacter gergoviae]EKV3542252.1 hypothetical protein [Pluralibacter gergoviae]EKV9897028.1 hypothetical protein [Pluralibacter gergoviae]EKW9974533.1 hypothetical protein [Pluralibacter gergoviae]ELC3071865.1 hypothetical protein [Pluralibacter gergoviae]
MKIIKGFSELLKKYDALPVTGWIFIDEDVDISSKEDLKKHNYYLPENDDEEFEMEDERSTFIEAPTFKDIVINKRTHNQKATGDEILDAVIYYLENDDFQD